MTGYRKIKINNTSQSDPKAFSNVEHHETWIMELDMYLEFYEEHRNELFGVIILKKLIFHFR